MITKGYKPPHPKTFGSKYKQRGNTPKIKKKNKKITTKNSTKHEFLASLWPNQNCSLFPPTSATED